MESKRFASKPPVQAAPRSCSCFRAARWHTDINDTRAGYPLARLLRRSAAAPQAAQRRFQGTPTTDEHPDTTNASGRRWGKAPRPRGPSAAPGPRPRRQGGPSRSGGARGGRCWGSELCPPGPAGLSPGPGPTLLLEVPEEERGALGLLLLGERPAVGLHARVGAAPFDRGLPHGHGCDHPGTNERLLTPGAFRSAGASPHPPPPAPPRGRGGHALGAAVTGGPGPRHGLAAGRARGGPGPGAGSSGGPWPASSGGRGEAARTSRGVPGPGTAREAQRGRGCRVLTGAERGRWAG